MRRFIVCCSIAGWLGSGTQLLLPAMAQVPPVTPTCSIDGIPPERMVPNAPLANRLESNSSFRVKCTGITTGNLRLSLGASSKPSNVSTRFRLVRTSGILAANPSDYTDLPVLIPYRSVSGTNTGDVLYQVQVISINGYLLPAAPDYAVKMQAELVQ